MKKRNSFLKLKKLAIFIFVAFLGIYIYKRIWYSFKVEDEKVLINQEMFDEQEQRDLFLKKHGERAGTFTDERDGRIYLTIKIGEQVWMAENLAFLPNANYFYSSERKPSLWNDIKYHFPFFQGDFWIYDNDVDNIQKYGYLYGLDILDDIVPKGWHIPTKKEWEELIENLGGETIALLKMKKWGKIDSLSNLCGLNILPAGWHCVSPEPTGGSVGEHSETYFYTGEDKEGVIHTVHIIDKIVIGQAAKDIIRGYSVRCVKNKDGN